jgi:hypothetical protein
MRCLNSTITHQRPLFIEKILKLKHAMDAPQPHWAGYRYLIVSLEITGSQSESIKRVRLRDCGQLVFDGWVELDPLLGEVPQNVAASQTAYKCSHAVKRKFGSGSSFFLQHLPAAQINSVILP